MIRCIFFLLLSLPLYAAAENIKFDSSYKIKSSPAGSSDIGIMRKFCLDNSVFVNYSGINRSTATIQIADLDGTFTRCNSRGYKLLSLQNVSSIPLARNESSIIRIFEMGLYKFILISSASGASLVQMF